MNMDGELPGFLASDNRQLAGLLPTESVSASSCGPAILAVWGLSEIVPSSNTYALSQVMRTDKGAVLPQTIAGMMRENPRALTQLLPPFAVVQGGSQGVCMLADSMGFRQLYHTVGGVLHANLMSTSAILAGQLTAAPLDHTAIAVQSLLGWQLGQRTLFYGVQKLLPGAIARIDGDGLRIQPSESSSRSAISLDEAVRAAAALLRASLERLLDEHPEAVLQLTGGQDSRILLSAVPPSRRRGLRAMTLGVPGAGDVEVATHLATRLGLKHEVHGLAELDDLSDADAWEQTRGAVLRLDGMSDPIALAALHIAERSFDQGVRIAGLGGEVARGFYYMGRVRERVVTRRAAEKLARWRMFVNEAVEPGLLRSDFASWSREAANSEVHAALVAGPKDWFRATDQLYLRHRMQRWAGVTDTALVFQRKIINPMLDPEFLEIAGQLEPRDKANSLFLARLQMELDPELGRIPLEGRPAPIAYAQPSIWRKTSRATCEARRIGKKVLQRVRGRNRPPAGGEILARKVVNHWRTDPSLLTAAALDEFCRADWLDALLDGRIDARPSSVAFLSNLIVARARPPSASSPGRSSSFSSFNSRTRSDCRSPYTFFQR